MPPYTLQQAIELGTLALLIGREARNQAYVAMLGVGWSVRTRTLKPRYWGTDWLSVMAHPYAYTSMTGPGDLNLVVWPQPGLTAWQAVEKAAEAAYLGIGPDPVSGATHYYSIDIAPPPPFATAPDSEFIIQLDRMRFYKAY